MSGAGPAQELVHASAVAVGGRALLITGASGSGKTTLALEMLSLGAKLIGDDQIIAAREGASVMLSAPRRIAGLVELRGCGILRLPAGPPAPLYLIADLDRASTGRMTALPTRDLCGRPYPVILGAGRPGLAAVLMAMLRADELPDPDKRLDDLDG